MPEEGRPLMKVSISDDSPASSTRATSARCTREPSGFTRSRTARNCSGVCSRVWVVMVALSRCPSTAGSPPSCPAETWAFWAWSAAETSSGVMRYLASRAGSSQIRMA